MGKQPTKAVSNIYCQARLKAAKYNDKFKSREGAAEVLNISVSSLAEYELDMVKFIPVDKVVIMAEVYHAPELLNDYCVNKCPIGSRMSIATQVTSLESSALKLLSVFSENNIDKLKNELLDIAEDGKIDVNEKARFDSVLTGLDKVTKVISELQLLAKKFK